MLRAKRKDPFDFEATKPKVVITLPEDVAIAAASITLNRQLSAAATDGSNGEAGVVEAETDAESDPMAAGSYCGTMVANESDLQFQALSKTDKAKCLKMVSDQNGFQFVLLIYLIQVCNRFFKLRSVSIEY